MTLPIQIKTYLIIKYLSLPNQIANFLWQKKTLLLISEKRRILLWIANHNSDRNGDNWDAPANL